jgi:SAM-dependent methyltransferase
MRAWDRVAPKYAAESSEHVAALRAGVLSFESAELPLLRELVQEGGRVLHLQCSHGQDALSLWKLGFTDVVGLDVSREMLALAREKATQLGAPVRFVEHDVLAPPDELRGWADVVYTGKGALPWVSDIDAWARVVARLVRPGGRLFLFEGHPLNMLWADEATDVVLRHDRDYFASGARGNDDFPALAVEAHTPTGEVPPTAWEFQWTLGAIVNAVIGAGLVLERLEEFPEHFWPQFAYVAPSMLARLPHTFLLIARLPG